MRRIAVEILGVVSALGALIFACSSDELSASENERLAAMCSTGPAQSAVPQRPGLLRDGPACAPRCGVQPLPSSNFGLTYGYDALPSGACTTGTHCGMGVSYTQTCGQDTHPCNLSGAECECVDAQWRCYIVSVGAGACLPCDVAARFQVDAGASADAN